MTATDVAAWRAVAARSLGPVPDRPARRAVATATSPTAAGPWLREWRRQQRSGIARWPDEAQKSLPFPLHLHWHAANRQPGLGRGNRDLFRRDERVGPCVRDAILMRQFVGDLLHAPAERRSGHDDIVAPAGIAGAHVDDDRAIVVLVAWRPDRHHVEGGARFAQRFEDAAVLAIAQLGTFGGNGHDDRSRQVFLADALA